MSALQWVLLMTPTSHRLRYRFGKSRSTGGLRSPTISHISQAEGRPNRRRFLRIGTGLDEAAEERRCDLIVMASHGRRGARRQARNFSSGVALACDEAGSEEYHRDRDLRRWRDTKLAAARNQWLESVPLQSSSAESEKNAMPVERRGPGLKTYPTLGPGRFEGEGDVIVSAQTLRVRTPGRLPRGVAMHRP